MLVLARDPGRDPGEEPRRLERELEGDEDIVHIDSGRPARAGGGERVGVVRRVLLGGGRGQRAVGLVAGEPVDALVAEEPLAVGLARRQHRRQVRQAGADDDERQTRLAHLVAGRADRRDVLGAEVLHLVDEDGDPPAEVGGQAADVGEELDEVDLDVAGVGAPLDGGSVDAGVPHFTQLGARLGVALREGLDDTEDVLDLLLLRVAELADRLVQRARQRPAQAELGACLELAGAPLRADGRGSQLVEQHGLADAPQPREDERALGPAADDPLEHDVEACQLLVATGELGRALARAGGVGVGDRVHDATVSACLTEGRYLARFGDRRVAGASVQTLPRIP